MQVKRHAKPCLCDKAVEREIEEAITSTLRNITTQEGAFVVNDSPWYFKKRRGGVSLCVVNSASYISTKFQNGLAEKKHWSGEKKLGGQSIDGYCEIDVIGPARKLNKENVITFLEQYLKVTGTSESQLGVLFSRFYGMYVKRSLFGIEDLCPELYPLFTEVDLPPRKLRIGVEFETGNIASSFRAFQKLDGLFAEGLIDAGVFVTCENKGKCSTRIWPASNRNGSIQELKNRKHRSYIAIPLWEFGFAPDGFRDDVPYLGSKGQLYRPKSTNSVIAIESDSFEVWTGENNEELLRKVIADSV